MEDPFDRSPLESLPTAVIAHDADGVVYANPAFAQLIGSPSASTVVGTALVDLAVEADRASAQQLSLSPDHGLVASGTFRLRHCDGGSLLVDIAQNLMNREAGPVALASIIDASRRAAAEARERASQIRFQTLVQNSSDIVVVHRHGRFRYVSPSVRRILGWEPDELVGQRVIDLVSSGDADRMRRRIREREHGTASGEPGRYRMRHKDGTWRWIATVSSIHLDDPELQGIVVNARDVTLEIETYEALGRSEARHRAMIEHLSDLIVVTDERGRITYVSPAVTRILGEVTGGELQPSIFGGIHPEDRTRARNLLDQAVHGAPGFHGPHRVRFRHADGTWRHLEVSASNRLEDSSVHGLILIVRDITEQQEAEELLRHLALHDPLTGLANRSLLRDQLEAALASGRRSHTATAALLVDLDGFKEVNDELGHDAGDAVLIAIAGRMKAAIRDVDTLARFGGDEFAAVLPAVGTNLDATEVARRLLGAISAPVDLPARTVRVSGSIGIAIAPQHGDDPDTLLRAADVAMFHAKACRSGAALYSAAQQR